MNTEYNASSFDAEVRLYVYDHFLKRGHPPTAAQTAEALSSDPVEVQAAYQRLHGQHVLVLQDESPDILMASPLSAVPTSFHVEVGDRTYWGNCVWDALGILAMLKQDGLVVTGCGDCNDLLTLTVKDDVLVDFQGVIHFAVPARHWWDNIKFT